MKRVGNLYEQVITKENIVRAIFEAYKSKKKKAKFRYKKYVDNADFYATKLVNDFHISGNYEIKTKTDSNSGKTRELQIPKFYPDQIVQHALTQITLPHIAKKITHECCCSIKERGTTSKRAKRLMAYFGYIKHSNSRNILKRYISKIKNAKTLLRKEVLQNGYIPTLNY